MSKSRKYCACPCGGNLTRPWETVKAEFEAEATVWTWRCMTCAGLVKVPARRAWSSITKYLLLVSREARRQLGPTVLAVRLQG